MQPGPGVGSSSQQLTSTATGDEQPAWVDAVITQLTTPIDRQIVDVEKSVVKIAHHVDILNDKVESLTEEMRSTNFVNNTFI